MKTLLQLGKILSRDEQKSIVGGHTCVTGFKRFCLIYGNPNPEYPDIIINCNSCDDWSGPAGDQCRFICLPTNGFGSPFG